MEQTNISDKKKKTIILVTTLILFIGVSFAFIAAQLSGGIIGNANVTADTTDNLTFSVDKDIYLNPTQFNVVEGGGGLSDTAVGTASLIANSTNNEASETYYVHFLINSNEYIYTTKDSKPEIVLTIIGPNGDEITEVQGLEYVTAQNADGSEVSGFDITTEMGLFTIASDYEIISTSSIDATEQEWTFTVTFINLTTNQTENGGSTLDAKIILSREETNYHEVCEEGTLACNVARLYNEENPESNGLYYHNGNMISTRETCTYNGNVVYSFSEGVSTDATDCQTVYSGLGYYYDASLITLGLLEGIVEEVAWNNESGICQTTSGISVYTDTNNTQVSQEQCSGYAVIMEDNASVIMINVGSGTMESETLALDADDNSYRYRGGDYEIADAYQGTYSKIYEEIIKRYCDGVESTFTNWCSGNSYYTLAYDTNNTQFQTINEALFQAVSDGYITGDNVKNYVCFGTDVTPCPEENLYRIIGVFDGQVKLIKADYATNKELGTNGDYSTRTYTASSYPNYRGSLTTINSYYWNNNTQTNTWSESNLNTVNLNQNFLNNIGTEWNDKIALHLWQAGVVNYETGNTNYIKKAYDYEIGQNSNNETYLAKIGLMYISDYGYAAKSSFWNTNMASYYNAISDNWMYMGMGDFPITATDALTNPSVFNIQSSGRLDCAVVYFYSPIRPVFYLNSDVVHISGTGTQSDPFIIA